MESSSPNSICVCSNLFLKFATAVVLALTISGVLKGDVITVGNMEATVLPSTFFDARFVVEKAAAALDPYWSRKY